MTIKEAKKCSQNATPVYIKNSCFFEDKPTIILDIKTQNYILENTLVQVKGTSYLYEVKNIVKA